LKYLRRDANLVEGIIGSHAAFELGEFRLVAATDLLTASKDKSTYFYSHGGKTPQVPIGCEAAVSGLLADLQDKDSDVREWAAAELGKINDAVLTHDLVRALTHKDIFVRQKAMQVVGYYKTDKQVLATLHHIAANDPAEEVRTVAREAAEKYANKLRYFSE
ncbi:MAG: HEAT repeat domain-containing protein, partial [bacterium]